MKLLICVIISSANLLKLSSLYLDLNSISSRMTNSSVTITLNSDALKSENFDSTHFKVWLPNIVVGSKRVELSISSLAMSISKSEKAYSTVFFRSSNLSRRFSSVLHLLLFTAFIKLSSLFLASCKHQDFINTYIEARLRKLCADAVFKCIPLNSSWCISMQLLLNFAPLALFGDNPVLVKITVCCRTSTKPLCKPLMV